MNNSAKEEILDNAIVPNKGLKTIGALPVVAFFIIMVIFNTWGTSQKFESPIVLAILNTLFLCIISLVVAYMATLSHKNTGVFAFLIAGCGFVFFGISNLYAGWVMPLAGGSNPTVTLHNIGSLFAGICQLMGAHYFLQELMGGKAPKLQTQKFGVLYSGIIVLVSITALLAFKGNLPVFFDPITGASPLRQIVLGGAIFLFGVAGLVFMEIHTIVKTEFAYWYGLALWLITIGLICVMIQPSVGSAIGWIGRCAQYVGCVYFVFAFFTGQKELREKNLSSPTQSNWVLWPYLEQLVRERTNNLNSIKKLLNKEISERKRAEEKYITAHGELQHLLAEAEKSRKVLLNMVEDKQLAEEKLSRLNANLEQRVINRTVQFEVVNKELESFSYSVSHDLRAPLRGIDGFTLALKEDYIDKLDEKAIKYIDNVRDETKRMNHLIDDLLQLSRLTSVNIELQNVNLSELAQLVFTRLQQENLNQKVIFEIQHGIIAEGDPNLLEVVLTNLLGNAYKYSSKVSSPMIQFGHETINGESVYFVRDNGIGFNMEYAKNLFGAFQRFHKKSEFEGTGIGLATVKRIINKHGGKVWADAKVNGGATFYFTLPESTSSSKTMQ